MAQRPSIRSAIRFGFKRFAGTPIEMDLKPYAGMIAEARAVDASSFDSRSLLEQARASRSEFAAAGQR